MANILFFSHGAGPMPLLIDKAHAGLRDYCQRLRPTLGRPDAVVIFSAHWEADGFLVGGAKQPALHFDYANFPKEAYQFSYPCPGSPELAVALSKAIAGAGLKSGIVKDQPLDHGAFVPMMMLFENADIPCVQIALDRKLDAAAHLTLGKALRPFLSDNILFIGSGFSFHNMAGFFDSSEEVNRRANVFDDWLKSILLSDEIEELERLEQLHNWQKAPYAQFCHPRAEHLLPLHICYGLAGSPADRYDKLQVVGKPAGMIQWTAKVNSRI